MQVLQEKKKQMLTINARLSDTSQVLRGCAVYKKHDLYSGVWQTIDPQ